MIYDMHTHYLGGIYTAAKSDSENFIAGMDKNDVKVSLILPNDGLYSDSACAADNDLIAKTVKDNSGRLIGLGVVYPRDKGAGAELTRCVRELGLPGIKLHPWLQGFTPLCDEYFEVAEAAEKLNTVIFFHDGTPPYTQPLALAETARMFPGLTVVLGHSGLNDLWKEALISAKKYENIWLCTCGCPYLGLTEIAKELDGERILFGSDYPLANHVDVRDRIRRIELLPVKDGIKEKLLYKNAQRFIKEKLHQ
jgi:predicted TIM-barrel fold metal-dependent hydrolase